MAVPTTEVTAHQTGIAGLLIFDVSSVGDERGWFQEKFHKAKLVAAGLPESFNVVQNSLALAFSLAGVVGAVRFRTTLRDTRDQTSLSRTGPMRSFLPLARRACLE